MHYQAQLVKDSISVSNLGHAHRKYIFERGISCDFVCKVGPCIYEYEIRLTGTATSESLKINAVIFLNLPQSLIQSMLFYVILYTCTGC